jgi:aromatic ring-opening dioxygenase catalytic subunit (LigB family)
LSQHDRRQDEIEHRLELVKCKEDSQKISEDKNTEYKELFRQTIENQYKTQAEFTKWKQLYQSNRK